MLLSIDVVDDPLTIISVSPTDTIQLGVNISKTLSEDDVLFISGDLGVGKTVLVKGIAVGLGIPKDEYILSPSYTLLRTYMGDMVLHHMDLYRIAQSHEAAELTAMAEDGILVIEWPEHGEGFLPEPTMSIEISMMTDERRRILLSGNDSVIAKLKVKK